LKNPFVVKLNEDLITFSEAALSTYEDLKGRGLKDNKIGLDYEQVKDILSVMQKALVDVGDFDKALEVNNKGISKSVSKKDAAGQLEFKTNIAVIYEKAGKTKDAENMLFDITKKAKELKLPLTEMIAWNAQGRIAIMNQDYETVKESCDEVFRLIEENDVLGGELKLEPYVNLAKAHLAEEDFVSAKRSIDLARSLHNDDGDRALVSLYEQLGELAIKQENFEEAKKAFELAIDFAERMDMDHSSISEKIAAIPIES
jgi:tetratricopeptide (TPR) repeat protein